MEKPIEEVLLSDLVYDGSEWVHHEGVVYSGEKETITWDGVTATEEHMVFISPDEKITLGEAKELGLALWRGNENCNQESDTRKYGNSNQLIRL